MKNRRLFKPSVAIAAALIATLTLSVAVFGADIANYIRIISLGEHAHFAVSPELSEEEIYEINARTQELIDAGYIIVDDGSLTFDWLTFTDAEEGRSHFITDAMLPTQAPAGFEFDHIFFFVETLEDLEQHGANMYMGVLFSNGHQEISMQIRYMTEESGFYAGGAADMRTIYINGHEAVVCDSTVNLLVGDVMYMFSSMNNVAIEELITMAESLK